VKRDECWVPTAPSGSISVLKKLAQNCTASDPELRPTFKQIVVKLDSYLDSHADVAELPVRTDLTVNDSESVSKEMSASESSDSSDSDSE
jgi:hypothetical protein